MTRCTVRLVSLVHNGILTPASDLDKHLGDLYPSIVGSHSGFPSFLTHSSQICAPDRELEIIQDLQEHVLKYDALMSRACDICAELDCLICFATASKAYDYRQPEMSEDNILIIKQGRYVLPFSYPSFARSFTV